MKNKSRFMLLSIFAIGLTMLTLRRGRRSGKYHRKRWSAFRRKCGTNW